MFFNTDPTERLQICIGSQPLECVNCFKFLGLNIDYSLSFKEHTDLTILKLKSSLAALSHLKHLVSKRCLIMVYFSLFQSIFEFSCELYGYRQESISARVTQIQKKAMRIIFGSKSNISQEMINHNIYSFDVIVNRKICIFMYNAYHLRLPNRLNSLFIRNYDVNLRHSKYLYNFKSIRPNTNIFSQSLSITGIQSWNKLPRHIKEASTLQLFKRLIKSYNPK